MSLTLLLVVLAAGVVFLLAGKLAFQPAKLLLRIGFSGFIGLAVLWLVNFAGAYVGFTIPLNPFTVLITGLLGVPGLAMLSVLEILIK